MFPHFLEKKILFKSVEMRHTKLQKTVNKVSKISNGFNTYYYGNTNTSTRQQDLDPSRIWQNEVDLKVIM